MPIGANLSSGQRSCSASLQPDRAVAVATNCYVIFHSGQKVATFTIESLGYNQHPVSLLNFLKVY